MNAIDQFNQYSRILANMAGMLLVTLMAYTLATSVIFFIEDGGNSTFEPGLQSMQPDSTASSTIDYGLAQLNLFGKEEEKAAPAVVDAPKTSLNLELQGVFANDNPALSSAIVAQKGKNGELFNIGDSLPGNAILNAVFDNHILLKRGSRIEKLSFPDTPLIKRLATSRTTQSTSRMRNTSATSSSRRQQIRDRLEKRKNEVSRNRNSSRTQAADLRREVSAYRQKLESDPQSTLAELGVTPVSEGDSKGYRIDSQVSQALLRRSGLKQGDVILSVNGRPVGNVSNDKSLIDQAMASKSIRVEVQRDTRRFFVTVPIPQ